MTLIPFVLFDVAPILYCTKGMIVVPEIILANCMDGTELNFITIHRCQLNPEHHHSAM
jgi:hypothetical protein